MIDEKKRLKMTIIAGAAHALKYRAKHPSASDEEVIQHVSRESNEILESWIHKNSLTKKDKKKE